MVDIPNRGELEREYARQLARILKRYSGNLLEILGDPPDLSNLTEDFWDKQAKELSAVLSPFGERVFLDAAQRMIAEQPVGIDWGLVSERAADWASRYTFDLVKDLNNTTRRQLQKAVDAYFREGQTRKQLEDQIGRWFGPVRSEMIAITEITRAAAMGEVTTGEELANQGIMMIATWNTNNDELVCPICRPLNHRKADGYEGIRTPYWIHPESGIRYGPPPSPHVRDRCWINWELPKVRR